MFVIDGVLTEEQRMAVYKTANNNQLSLQYMWFESGRLLRCMKPIVDAVAKHVDIQACVGYEMWTQYNTRPEWHYDKDEGYLERTGQSRFPICSIVYYPLVDGLVGGEFKTEDIVVTPKTNRLLCFGPGVLHTVNPFEGTRFSVLINPWAYKPETKFPEVVVTSASM